MKKEKNKMRKTFTRVAPIMPASIQAAVYNDTELLFDWHKVEDFKASTIDNIKVTLRGTNGADQTPVGIDLLFATNRIPVRADANVKGNTLEVTPGSLGTTGAAPNLGVWLNNLIGIVPVTVASSNIKLTDYNDGDLIFLNSANVDLSGKEIPVSGDLYVAAIAKGSLDFRTTVQVNEDDFASGSQTVITVDTKDIKGVFSPGDLIHAVDNAVLGTIKSIDGATQFTLTSANKDAIVDNDVLYNVTPITLILGGSY